MMKSPSDNAASPGGAGRSERARSESETSAKPATGGAARPPDPGESSIVLATFPSAGAAERTVMQLGRAFRNMARRGHADAFIVTGDQHGSFSLVQSRVVTASGLVGAVMRVSASVMVGFHGLVSALRGARTGATAVRSHGRRVGSGADRARELLGQAGEHGAGLVIRCPDDVTADTVEARATQRASDHWHGSRSEFLAALQRRGGEYDWLHKVVGMPAHGGRQP